MDVGFDLSSATMGASQAGVLMTVKVKRTVGTVLVVIHFARRSALVSVVTESSLQKSAMTVTPLLVTAVTAHALWKLDGDAMKILNARWI